VPTVRLKVENYARRTPSGNASGRKLPSSEPGAAAVLGTGSAPDRVDAEADLQKAIAIMRAIADHNKASSTPTSR